MHFKFLNSTPFLSYFWDNETKLVEQPHRKTITSIIHCSLVFWWCF